MSTDELDELLALERDKNRRLMLKVARYRELVGTVEECEGFLDRLEIMSLEMKRKLDALLALRQLGPR